MGWSAAEEPGADDGPVAQPVAATLRIRQIELVGFKSFRDRTVLRFPSGVTAVVGPNGCGKSNVVDAIRWVLGEQSAKRLRGEGMEDVIFGGNERQAPLGMAQVSIVFETDGLPLDQFALLREGGHPIATPGASDVMVTRRYLRSGESDYFLNGVPCRLRDITELFLGTGLGGKAYAIIEQGRVEQLISAKPEDLRLFIEEAAGTTLYRSRRQMAERKMERTRENLARVHDILREVERQLGGLRRQAKRAEQYRALQGEIQQLDLALSSRERAHLAQELETLRGEQDALDAAMGSLRAEVERLEGERRAAREQEVAAQRRLQDAQTATFEARAACEAARHEIARLETRASEIAAQDALASRDAEVADAERATLAAERAQNAASLGELERTIAAAQAHLATREAEVARTTEALAGAGAALEEARSALVDALTDEARARNAATALAERQREEEVRRARVEAHAAGLASREQAVHAEAEAAARRVVDLQGRLERLEGAKRERADALRRVFAERASWEASLEGMKEGLARVRSRRDSLRELEDSHAGYGEGVRAILAASSREEALALVAEILEIPAEHERAVAAVLGEQLQAVVMRDLESARDAVQALRRAGAGRAACLPLGARRAGGDGRPPSGRPLLDCLRARAGYEDVAAALLGRVVMVDDLDAALAAWQRDGDGLTFVTPAGETLDPSGAIAGGSERAEETLLAQRRELRALDEEVERRERDVAQARARHEELTATVTASEAAVHDVDAEIGHVAVAVVAAEKDVQRARQESRDLREQADMAEADLGALQAHLAALASDDAGLRRTLAAAEGRRRDLEQAVTDAEASHGALQATLSAGQALLTEERVRLASEGARRDALTAAVGRLERSHQDLERRLEVLAARRRVDADALAQTRDAAVAARARLEAAESEATARVAAVEAAERESTRGREGMAAVEEGIVRLQAELDGGRARANALQVQVTERRLALNHLEDTIRERYGRALEDEAVTSDEGELAGADERLAQLRARVTAMGDVNVAALAEMAELEERQRFLGGQRDDLDRALEDLRKTIARLNRTSRTRFRETFERVDATFREVFPKLFRGGRAELRLSDEEHVLESGVEIVVQPPGKRIGPLDALSGGEKALTAVSLIFALFLTKPSPFCFLDEVDAPLDDANIGRFNEMVREMSAHSQFILITHNKRTMEVAETLYGITMEEPGVSKVVSVRLPR